MGGLPGDLPGYQKVFKPEVIEKFEKAWNTKLSSKVGLTIPEIFNGAHDGSIRFLYIMGENPMVSDPDINHVRASLENVDFLVCQDIFMNETTELADVVLPAASFAKRMVASLIPKEGTKVRKAIEPSKARLKILMEIMNYLGYEKRYLNPSEIMDEIASVTPSYGE